MTFAPTTDDYHSIEQQIEQGLGKLSETLASKAVPVSLQVRLLEVAKIVYEHLAFHSVVFSIDNHSNIDLWSTIRILEPYRDPRNPNGYSSSTIDVKIFQINITDEGSDLYASWNQFQNGYELKFNIKGEFEHNRQELGYFLENAKLRYESAKLRTQLSETDGRLMAIESQFNNFKMKMKQSFEQLQYL